MGGGGRKKNVACEICKSLRRNESHLMYGHEKGFTKFQRNENDSNYGARHFQPSCMVFDPATENQLNCQANCECHGF